MPRKLFCLPAIAGLSLLSACAAQTAADLTPSQAACERIGAAGPISILFIGNSLTYYNNSPELAAAILGANGHPTQTAMVAFGGAALSDHVDSAALNAALAQREWDYVVLQEQSSFNDTYLVDGRYRVRLTEAWHESAAALSTAARARGAQVVLLAPAAQLDAPEDQAVIDRNYLDAGRAIGACVVRVSLARTVAERAFPREDFYAEDGLHPSPIASYLQSAVVARLLGGEALEAMPPSVSGHPVEETEGGVNEEQTTALVSLSASQAAQIAHSVNLAAVSAISAPSLAVHGPTVPTVPDGGALPTDNELAGSWVGETNLYPIAATLQLRIHGSAESALQADLTILPATPRPDPRQATNLAIERTDRGLAFDFPRGPNGTTIRFEGVYRTGGTLEGVAHFRSQDGSLEGYGRWSATREAP